MEIRTVFTVLVLFLFSVNLASAITVSDVSQDLFFPGDRVGITIDLKNNLDEDLTDASFNLVFDNQPFIPIGGSEKSWDEFDDGDRKSFTITIKSAQDIKPGDYNVPYTLSYTDEDDEFVEKTGSIGIVVGAKTELDFDIELENNVIGKQGQISFKIINGGFGDVKFVSVKIIPEGFTIIGTDRDYIGTVDSDDFEVANFDVLFDDKDARVIVVVNYKDFDNNDKVENIQRDLTIYSVDEAVDLGIIERNNTFIYVVFVVIIIIAWLVYRNVKKRQKKKKRR